MKVTEIPIGNKFLFSINRSSIISEARLLDISNSKEYIRLQNEKDNSNWYKSKDIVVREVLDKDYTSNIFSLINTWTKVWK